MLRAAFCRPRFPATRRTGRSTLPMLPFMILALTSDTFSTAQMYDAASSVLQQKLSQIEGVGQVDGRRELAARRSASS